MIVIATQHPYFTSQSGHCYRPCAVNSAAAGDRSTKVTKTKEDSAATAAPAAPAAPTASSPKAEGRVVMERTPIHQQETAEAATIALDVTGFTTDNLNIQVDDHVVSVSGQRQNRLGDTYMIRRRFKVDKKTVDQEQIRASLSDGVLEIIVPKKPNAGPRAIPISISATSTIISAASTESLTASPSKSQDVLDEEVDTSSETSADQSTDDAIATEEEKEDSVEVETVEEDHAGEEAEENATADEETWENVVEHA